MQPALGLKEAVSETIPAQLAKQVQVGHSSSVPEPSPDGDAIPSLRSGPAATLCVLLCILVSSSTAGCVAWSPYPSHWPPQSQGAEADCAPLDGTFDATGEVAPAWLFVAILLPIWRDRGGEAHLGLHQYLHVWDAQLREAGLSEPGAVGRVRIAQGRHNELRIDFFDSSNQRLTQRSRKVEFQCREGRYRSGGDTSGGGFYGFSSTHLVRASDGSLLVRTFDTSSLYTEVEWYRFEDTEPPATTPDSDAGSPE